MADLMNIIYCSILLEIPSKFYLKKNKKCVFNKKKIAVGEVAYKMEENCVELVCTKVGTKVMLTLEHIDGCSFIVTTTPAPTTPAKPKCNYKPFGEKHTMNLKRNKACKFHRSGVTEEQKQIILKTHNDLRTKIARGQEKQGNPGPQPKATNMREMVWNDQLAEVAQAWAEQCAKGHDLMNNRRICDSTYRTVGQNVFNNLGHADVHLWENAVKAWYGEVEHMPNTDVSSYQDPPTGIIGHYTQVVWAKTYEVGCGGIHYTMEKNGVTYPNSKKYICNYGPGGNYNKAKIYEAGKTASKCENGKSANYPFLCA
ncbi:unnamed protein product, partial [Meganyctiphanes norvegica]